MKILIINKFKYPLFNFLYKNFSSQSIPDSFNTSILLSFYSDAKKTFLNPILQRNVIIKDTKGKSGVYCWINLLNGKYYIGSGIELNTRLSDYFQDWYYKDRKNLTIVRALLKYGINNFALLILDFTEKENTLTREQFWIDELKPAYNILTETGNSKGYKHSVPRHRLRRGEGRKYWINKRKSFRPRTLRRG
jgi:GIY-YIG catalytic domain